MIARFAGLDVNGAWDRAAVRSIEDGTVQCVDGGIAGSAIRLINDPTTVIGGIQAALAPHGRGPGWGRIGDTSNRLPIRTALRTVQDGAGAAREAATDAITALMHALVGDAAFAFYAIPDSPEFDEAAQDNLIQALRSTAAAHVTLLWRSVATLLGWASTVAPDERGGLVGKQVAAVSLMGDGTYVTQLGIEMHQGKGVPLLVPVRSSTGTVLRGSFAGEKIVAAYAAEIGSMMNLQPDMIERETLLPWRHGVGAQVEIEVIRLNNRSWRQLRGLDVPVRLDELPHAPREAAARLRTADLVIVDGAFVGNASWRRRVLDALDVRADEARVVVGSVDLAALGCLEAAERADRGDPVYFDFLPQIQINALAQGEHAFVDLVPKHERAQGGRKYTGRAAANFGISKGLSSLTFYLLKEGFEWPRKATVELPEPPDRSVKIDVTVEQLPAQGSARIEIVSDEYEVLRRRPVVLDWTHMEEVRASPSSLLTELEDAGGAYPNVAQLEAHPIHWHPENPAGDFRKQLAAYLAQPLPARRHDRGMYFEAITLLRNRIRAKQTPRFHGRSWNSDEDDTQTYHLVSSGGFLPESRFNYPVPEDAHEQLDLALAKAAHDLDLILRTYDLKDDQALANALAGFTTWAFARCPKSVTEVLLSALEGRIKLHPGLVPQGLGRTVHEPEDTRRFFSILMRQIQGGKNLNAEQCGGLAAVLTRRETASALLTSEQAKLFTQAFSRLIKAENAKEATNGYKRTFKFALFILSGLLRYRQVQPNFLVPAETVEGEQVLGLMHAAGTRMAEFQAYFERQTHQAKIWKNQQQASNAAKRLERLQDIVSELVEFLNERGRNLNIIHLIDSLEDED